MATEQAAVPEQEILNVGCGRDQPPHAWNVDIDPAVEPDELVDLAETPWPWPADAFSVIRAHHVLEHLPRVPWTEIGRVLRPRGALVIRYPIGHTRFEDTSHRLFWGYQSAEQLAGDRKHGHEAPLPLSLVNKRVSWDISHAEPLVRAYTRYRRLVSGDGPWLEQIPGVHGHVTATYRYDP